MSSMTKLTSMEMREGLLQRDFSAVELAKQHLERIRSTNSELNSFITVTEREALEQAKRADEILAEQGANSPLLTGIPVAIKDMLVTKGIKTTCASKILYNFIPPYDGTAVSKLKASGAVIVGKTNLDEFAMGSSNENSAFGPVRNPWKLDRVPGGSSGGSAVAVASGQAPLALGTDTGGSIRQPASFTGICGLKPTYGRVSRYGAVAFASSLDQIGPFARDPRDLALLLQVIAGHDENDSTSVKQPVPNYLEELIANRGKGLAGLRVGVPKEYFISGIDSEVESNVKSAIAKLSELGAQIVDISLSTTDLALAAYYILAPAEASSNLARYDGVRYGLRAESPQNLAEMYEKTRGEGFGAETKRRIMIGNYVLSTGYYDAYYLKAQQVRTLIINDFRSVFNSQCDVIATPVTPTTAFKLGEKVSSPLQMYLADIFTIPASLAGLPGLSIPCGIDSCGLPIGIQLLGRPLEELQILTVAQELLDALQFDTKKLAG